MVKIEINSTTPINNLKDIDSVEHSVINAEGITLITFFRFSTCPFCNLRLRALNSFIEPYGSKIKVIAVFGSPEAEVRKAKELHHPSFPLVSNADRSLYKIFSVTKSWLGVIKGMIFRFPSLIKGMVLQGKIPLNFDGMLNTMPASFIIDKNGIIIEVYYGKDEGDHISFKRITEIINK
ncbi:MAG: redoxin domain-containing protein [Spirochaetaceae bacterium]